MRILCALLLVLSSLAAWGQPCQAEVVVRTTGGRMLRGEVDQTTDQNQLWLRRDTDSISLTSSVAWERIESAALDGEVVTANQLAEIAPKLATAPRESLLVAYGPPPSAPLQPNDRPAGSRVTSIEVDARLVNLDRTAEPDGYEIVIAAIDNFGHEVPVRGNLYAHLQGERNVHHTGRIRFENLQTWSQPIARKDFRDGLAMYVLPFRGLQPEFDDELRPDAQLNVRLGVFGEGNFSATVPVPLWEFSPFRDRLQKFDGSRFFRNEVTRRPRLLSTDPPGIYRRWFRNY